MNVVPHTVPPQSLQENKEERLHKTIWSVAGGKGGTGKTILTANIGIGLAILGYDVILIDGDLGAPNLHNYLRIKRPKTTLDDFLTKKVTRLTDVIVKTSHENLKFIGGGTSLVGITNLHYAKKMRLIRHINKLKADIILVDLGAGISNNTIDFFNISTRGIVISNPEPNANQDTYFFLKNAVYRRIKSYMKFNEDFKEAFKNFSSSDGNGTFEMPKFYNFLQEYSSKMYYDFNEYITAFRPRLILNKLRKRRQKKDGIWFVNLARKFLEIEVDYVGVLKYDKRIIRSSEEVYPFILRYPSAKITKNIFTILNDLNSSDMKHHEVHSFKQFCALLKKQQKYWE